jgi:rod shape-determining protein MreD
MPKRRAEPVLWGSTISTKIISGAVILLVLILFQSLLSEVVTIRGAKLDLAIILLVFIALTRGPKYGVIFGFFIGLLLDVYTPQTLGWGALVKCLIGFVVGNFKDNLYLESLYSKGGLIFFTLAFNDLLYYIFATGINTSTFRILVNYSLPSAFYTSVVGMLLFFMVSRIPWERLEAKKGSVQFE